MWPEAEKNKGEKEQCAKGRAIPALPQEGNRRPRVTPDGSVLLLPVLVGDGAVLVRSSLG